jgi:hypothetical protein
MSHSAASRSCCCMVHRRHRKLLDAYEAELGGRLSDLWFFDLFLGLRPFAHFEEWWLPAYVDLGLESPPAVADERLREFMTGALSRAPG